MPQETHSPIEGLRPTLVLELTGGALGIARSLGRLGVPVYAATDNPRVAAARSRYVSDVIRWDPRADDQQAALDQLLETGDRLGQPVLIPTTDVTALFVEDHAPALREAFVFAKQPSGLARQLSSKQGMFELCSKHGIPTPQTWFPEGRDELNDLLDKVVFPVVLKPIDGSVVRAGSGPRTVIARDRSEVLSTRDRMGTRLLVQEYIPGGAETVWMFNGYFNEQSECLFGMTGRKLRQYPPYGGATSLGVCAENTEVEAVTRETMATLQYRGVLDCGYRFDARDGTYKLLDVNPRVGQTFRLFLDTAEMDVVRTAYFDLTGQRVDVGMPRWGRRWLVEDTDILATARYFRDRHLGPVAWAKSFREVEEASWFASDDLRPFFGRPWQLIRRGLRGRS